MRHIPLLTAALLCTSFAAQAEDKTSANVAPATQTEAPAPAMLGTKTGQPGNPPQAPVPASTVETPGTPTAAQQSAAPAAVAPHAEGAQHEDSAHHLKEVKWHHDGPFGTYDRAALQRGFQVYKQVCSTCHSMNYMSYRNLSALGYNDDEVKAIAADVQIKDGPNDAGEMFDRAGRPSDRFKAPFANEQAARAANGGALPKDLSLMVKARHGGENYVYSLLTGYENPPAGVTIPNGLYYNKYFEGHQIAMPPPLSEGVVTYADGTQASVDQMAKDVAQFLTWAAEPNMEERKKMGFQSIIFLIIFSIVMYLAKQQIWAKMKNKPKQD